MMLQAPFIIETSRTLLRPFALTDASEMYALNADPEVIRYTGDPPFESVEAAHLFLQGYNPYETHGCGRWAVIRKEDSAWLGWCGVKFQPSESHYDLGYRFHKQFWGQGYATETALACLQWSFEHLPTDTIVAHAMKENEASVRVLEKIGMHRIGETVCGNQPAWGYVVQRMY
jgi:[ribosomal protein S5]-alanine N-acetyltransferase